MDAMIVSATFCRKDRSRHRRRDVHDCSKHLAVAMPWKRPASSSSIMRVAPECACERSC